MTDTKHDAKADNPPAPEPKGPVAPPAQPPLSGTFKVTKVTKEANGAISVTLAHQSDNSIPAASRFAVNDHAPSGTLELAITTAQELRFQLNQQFAVTLVPKT